MHPENIFNNSYDFLKLSEEFPALKPLLFKNEYDKWTIDFGNKKNIRLFNQALIKQHFAISSWNIPEGNLCPTIPGRADYLYYLKDKIGAGEKRILDIGTGASAVYPILGNRLFDWKFVGSEISTKSMANAETILSQNDIQKTAIEIRQQKVKNHFFKNIIQPNEKFDATICNPPFFESEEQARSWNWKKWNRGAKGEKTKSAKSVGTLSEMVCKGGEKRFITNMIKESVDYKNQVNYFTCLVSKNSTIPFIEKACAENDITGLEFIEMKTGQKTSRIAVWRY